MATVTNRRPEPSVGGGIGEGVVEDGWWDPEERDELGEGAG